MFVETVWWINMKFDILLSITSKTYKIIIYVLDHIYGVLSVDQAFLKANTWL